MIVRSVAYDVAHNRGTMQVLLVIPYAIHVTIHVSTCQALFVACTVHFAIGWDSLLLAMQPHIKLAVCLLPPGYQVTVHTLDKSKTK